MKKIIILIVVALLISLNGCKDTNKQSEDIASLEKQVKELQEQLVFQSLDLYTLKHAEAIFSPSSKGYALLNSNVGSFVVALDRITPYANGYKLMFRVGNPNLMRIESPVVTVRWGRALGDHENYLDWEKTLKSQEVKVSNPLLPGVWNKVSLVISPATSEETGFIGLSLKVDEIILYQDFRRGG